MFNRRTSLYYEIQPIERPETPGKFLELTTNIDINQNLTQPEQEEPLDSSVNYPDDYHLFINAIGHEESGEETGRSTIAAEEFWTVERPTASQPITIPGCEPDDACSANSCDSIYNDWCDVTDEIWYRSPSDCQADDRFREWHPRDQSSGNGLSHESSQPLWRAHRRRRWEADRRRVGAERLMAFARGGQPSPTVVNTIDYDQYDIELGADPCESACLPNGLCGYCCQNQSGADRG